MRISTNHQYEVYQLDIQAASARLFTATQQVSSGKKITRPSQDPFATTQSITMRGLKSAVEQYQKNLQFAKSNLSNTEATSSEIRNLVVRAQSLAVSGASSSTDQTGRAAMAAEIQQLQSRLLDLANTKTSSGTYLFSGQRTDVKPYTVTGSTLTFNGDSNPINVETGPGETLKVNPQGEPMISSLYSSLESLKSNLTGGQVGAISGVDLNNLQGALDSIAALRSDVGSKLKHVADLTTQWQRRADDLTEGISDVEDVDAAEAIMQYQQANQAYSAALTVASQGFRLSLMDFIKG